MEKFEKLTAVAAPMPASNIDTDIIMPKAFLKRIDKEGVLEGLFHDIRLYEDGTEREEFVLNQPEYRNARILVTGPNFGCGSSREQAPEIIKALGIQCVIAKSFARIFFRNSINNGLLLIEQPTLHDDIKEGDTVSVVMNEHIDYNGKTYPIASLPENLMDIIRAGGLVKAMRKLNCLD